MTGFRSISTPRESHARPPAPRFFVTFKKAQQLDGKHVVFGQVVGGMDVVEAVNKLAVKGRDTPKGEAKVVKAGCTKYCEPRPEVTAKCAHRDTETTKVQNRPIHKCLD